MFVRFIVNPTFTTLHPTTSTLLFHHPPPNLSPQHIHATPLVIVTGSELASQESTLSIFVVYGSMPT